MTQPAVALGQESFPCSGVIAEHDLKNRHYGWASARELFNRREPNGWNLGWGLCMFIGATTTDPCQYDVLASQRHSAPTILVAILPFVRAWVSAWRYCLHDHTRKPIWLALCTHRFPVRSARYPMNDRAPYQFKQTVSS